MVTVDRRYSKVNIYRLNIMKIVIYYLQYLFRPNRGGGGGRPSRMREKN